MIDVDEIEARGFLAEPDLAGAGIAYLDLFPMQYSGAAELVNSDRMRHALLHQMRAQKKSPARCETGRGIPF